MCSNNQFIFYVHVWIVHKKYNNFSFSVDAKIDSSLDRINLDFGPHIVHQGGLTWVLKENNEKLSGMQSLSLTQLFMGKSCRESLYWKKKYSITIQKFFEFILRFEKYCSAWGIGKALYYRLRTRTYTFFQCSFQFKHVVIKRIIDTFFLSHRVFILQIVSFDWSLYFVILTYWAHFSLLLTKNIVPPAKK